MGCGSWSCKNRKRLQRRNSRNQESQPCSIFYFQLTSKKVPKMPNYSLPSPDRSRVASLAMEYKQFFSLQLSKECLLWPLGTSAVSWDQVVGHHAIAVRATNEFPPKMLPNTVAAFKVRQCFISHCLLRKDPLN